MAGCGSAGPPSGTTTDASGPPASAYEFSRCMRADGVPYFPDPGAGGYQRSSRLNLQSPAAHRAIDACAKYLPPSGPTPPTPESVRVAEIALAKCMRAHGVPNFPDPDKNGDIQFPIDSPIPRSPAFRGAQEACKKYMGSG